MSAAADIAKALGGKRNGRTGYLVHCPVPSHGLGRGDRDPSLSIRDCDDGARLLVRCFAGCAAQDVLAELSRLGFDDGGDDGVDRGSPRRRRRRRAPPTPPRTPPRIEPDAEALATWRAAKSIRHTHAERYLRARGINGVLPPSLRYQGRPRYFDGRSGGGSGDALILPALIAAIQEPPPGRRIIAISRTYLDPRGDRKAQVSTPRKGLGRYHGGTVRLGPAGPVLGLAEGLEDALSAMRLVGDISVWAAVGAGRLHTIILPSVTCDVHVFGDNDAPGRAAADRAAEEYTGQGRRVVLRWPPEGFKDWNAWLRAGAPPEAER